MDSLTQIVLGGAVGEAVLGKKIGNKAILWGAIGGTIPDLDTLPGQFMDTVSRLEIHRGFSHSIVFAVLVSPLLGVLLKKLYSKHKNVSTWDWTQLFFWSIFTHPLLDIFTTWGTQLFWPYEWRIAIKSIFVIDPLYTLPFLICLLFVLFLRRGSRARIRFNQIGLIISSCYLLYTLGVKTYVDGIFKTELERKGIEFLRFDSRPTAFNSILWTSNIETESEFLVAYYSLLDKDTQLEFYRFPKNKKLLLPYRNDPEVERLLFLTQGFYTIEQLDNGIAMNDLRFGLTEGFDKGKGQFVFVYEIKQSLEGIEVTQRQQNFEGMKEVMNKLWSRVLGNKQS